MTKIIVDIIAARDLKFENGLLGEIDPYIQVKVGENLLTRQKYTTNTHKNSPNNTINFGEAFEFNVHENDSLKVKLYDDDFVMYDNLGETCIPLKEVFESGSLESWFPLGEGVKYNGEVLLNIHTPYQL